MRSKDHHNSKRFILEAGKVNALIKINEELILENIKNRQLQFGKVISLPNERNYSDLKAKEYVESLFEEAKNGNSNKACKKIHSIFLDSIKANNKTNKCYLLNSNDILLAPNSNILIEKRQNAASELNQKCRWSNSEVSLLLKLKKDLNGNITLINEYFPKRTFKSIAHKLNSIETKKIGNHK